MTSTISSILHKPLADCEAFTANDGCLIKEWVRPDKDGVDLPYSLAQAVVEPGKQTYPHYLKQSELYIILNGSGDLIVSKHSLIEQSKVKENDHIVTPVSPGSSALVPAGHEQYLINTSDQPLEFLVIVSPPWQEVDDIRT